MFYLSEIIEGLPLTVSKHVKGVTKRNVCGRGEACSCETCKSIDLGVSLHCCELGSGGRITISDVRKGSFLLSRKASKYRAILYHGFSGVSDKCANALLKTLEEPPENTQLFLGVKTQWVLPSTILSRCSIKQLEFVVSGESYQAVSGLSLENQLELIRKWGKEKELSSHICDVVHSLWQQAKYSEAYKVVQTLLSLDSSGSIVNVLNSVRELK